MRRSGVLVILGVLFGPSCGLADSVLSPAERFDLNCATAALKTSSAAETLGNQEAADSAYETALFYEGRLTARDEQANWVARIRERTDAHPQDARAYAITEVSCMKREQELLKMPANSEQP